MKIVSLGFNAFTFSSKGASAVVTDAVVAGEGRSFGVGKLQHSDLDRSAGPVFLIGHLAAQLNSWQPMLQSALQLPPSRLEEGHYSTSEKRRQLRCNFDRPRGHALPVGQLGAPAKFIQSGPE